MQDVIEDVINVGEKTRAVLLTVVGDASHKFTILGSGKVLEGHIRQLGSRVDEAIYNLNKKEGASKADDGNIDKRQLNLTVNGLDRGRGVFMSIDRSGKIIQETHTRHGLKHAVRERDGYFAHTEREPGTGNMLRQLDIVGGLKHGEEIFYGTYTQKETNWTLWHQNSALTTKDFPDVIQAETTAKQAARQAHVKQVFAAAAADAEQPKQPATVPAKTAYLVHNVDLSELKNGAVINVSLGRERSRRRDHVFAYISPDGEVSLGELNNPRLHGDMRSMKTASLRSGENELGRMTIKLKDGHILHLLAPTTLQGHQPTLRAFYRTEDGVNDRGSGQPAEIRWDLSSRTRTHEVFWQNGVKFRENGSHHTIQRVPSEEVTTGKIVALHPPQIHHSVTHHVSRPHRRIAAAMPGVTYVAPVVSARPGSFRDLTGYSKVEKAAGAAAGGLQAPQP